MSSVNPKKLSSEAEQEFKEGLLVGQASNLSLIVSKPTKINVELISKPKFDSIKLPGPDYNLVTIRKRVIKVYIIPEPIAYFAMFQLFKCEASELNDEQSAGIIFLSIFISMFPWGVGLLAMGDKDYYTVEIIDLREKEAKDYTPFLALWGDKQQLMPAGDAAIKEVKAIENTVVGGKGRSSQTYDPLIQFLQKKMKTNNFEDVMLINTIAIARTVTDWPEFMKRRIMAITQITTLFKPDDLSIYFMKSSMYLQINKFCHNIMPIRRNYMIMLWSLHKHSWNINIINIILQVLRYQGSSMLKWTREFILESRSMIRAIEPMSSQSRKLEAVLNEIINKYGEGSLPYIKCFTDEYNEDLKTANYKDLFYCASMLAMHKSILNEDNCRSFRVPDLAKTRRLQLVRICAFDVLRSSVSEEDLSKYSKADLAIAERQIVQRIMKVMNEMREIVMRGEIDSAVEFH